MQDVWMKLARSRSSWSTLLLAFFVSNVIAQPAQQQAAAFEMPVAIRSAEEIPFKTSVFTFVRIKYNQSGPFAGGGAWMTDWPDADRVFSNQVEKLTGLSTNSDGLLLELTDPALGLYPFIYIVEAGSLRLSDEEVSILRDYLAGGGFLMVDDFWGEYEWASIATEFRRVFPDREPVELFPDHEIFRSFYEITAALRVPRGGRRTEEAHLRGLFDNDGRLMVVFCHNLDFGDGWEHAEDPFYPREFSFGQAIPMGINIVVYALSH